MTRPPDASNSTEKAAAVAVASVCRDLAERWREPEIAFQVCADALSRLFAIHRACVASTPGTGAERATVDVALLMLDDSIKTWEHHAERGWEGPLRVAIAYRDEIKARLAASAGS